MAKSKIEKIHSGIDKYQFLRHLLYKTDVSTDREFQKVFNGFFEWVAAHQLTIMTTINIFSSTKKPVFLLQRH